jgi:hypothetical protein
MGPKYANWYRGTNPRSLELVRAVGAQHGLAVSLVKSFPGQRSSRHDENENVLSDHQSMTIMKLLTSILRLANAMVFDNATGMHPPGWFY